MDDVRATQSGWIRTWSPDETIALLKIGQVQEFSLDHDLASGDNFHL
nr:cyclic-phosphate processing receiver domain-containing protein [Endozoicomonas sp. ONNA2]